MPAEKARPAPVSTTARTSLSCSISSKASCISLIMPRLIAFIASGRFSVIKAPPRCFS